MDHPLSRRTALLLFAAVVLSWGLNWAVTKIIVHSVFPLWRPRSARRSARSFQDRAWHDCDSEACGYRAEGSARRRRRTAVSARVCMAAMRSAAALYVVGQSG